MKDFLICNKSNVTAIIKQNGNKTCHKILPGSEYTVSAEQVVDIEIFPEINSAFRMFDSEFVVLTDYHISADSISPKLNIYYQEAKPLLNVNHIYKRLCLFDAEKEITPQNRIIPEKRRKSTFFSGFLVNIPLTILFNGVLILAVSLILGYCFSSVKVGVIASIVLLLAISLYEVLENLVFDKLFDRAKRKNRILKEIDEPLYFDICSESNYIEQCFQKQN